MSLLEIELRKLSVNQLRKLARRELPSLAAAAQAELANRPKSQTETSRAAVFPSGLQ